MTDLLTWITTYGDSLSVVSLLLIMLGVVVIGLYRRWWAPGWLLAECETERDKLQKQVDEETERLRRRIEVLEALPAPRPRRNAS